MPQAHFPMFPNYGYPDHTPFPFAVKAAEGSWLYSEDGEKYLDFFAGIAVNNLGHRHPKVQAAIEDQLKKVWHTSNYFLNPLVVQLAQSLVSVSGHCSRAFFCNSGVEANEAAFKLARKFSGKKKDSGLSQFVSRAQPHNAFGNGPAAHTAGLFSFGRRILYSHFHK